MREAFSSQRFRFLFWTRVDFKAQPSLNEPLVRELLRGEYIDKRENVLLIGTSGTGPGAPAGNNAFRRGERVPGSFLH